MMDRCLKMMWDDMKESVFGSGKTKYVFNVKKMLSGYIGESPYSIFYMCFEDGNLAPSFCTEFIDILKKEYPGCDIEYVRSDVIETFTIDWS